jgi:hypothetical protein
MCLPVSAPLHATGRLAWAALGLLGCLVLTAGLFVARVGPPPMVTEAQIEQRALNDGIARGLSPITQVTAISVTQGRLRPNLRCDPIETAWHALLVAARAEGYNPCDPNARLWLVELRGRFPLAFSAQPVRFIYTAAGEFVRSESGP